MPAAVIMHYADGVYSTDADNYEEDDQKSTILMRMVTMPQWYTIYLILLTLTCVP